jgi:hypothetical protein
MICKELDLFFELPTVGPIAICGMGEDDPL